MGTCCSVSSVEEAESANQFRAIDANQNNLASRDEMAQYVASRAELWAMLAVNLGESEDKCRDTATRVAMELASGKRGKAAQETELTEAQFHAFRTRYILDGEGAKEFFHRCVFATFDIDGNDSLDPQEIDRFLDTFYKSGSIFEGDSRLPPRDVLKQRLLENAHNGHLNFQQIRLVIQGTAGGSSSLAPQKSPDTSTQLCANSPAPVTPVTPASTAVPSEPEELEKEETSQEAFPLSSNGHNKTFGPVQTTEKKSTTSRRRNTINSSPSQVPDDSPQSGKQRPRKSRSKTPQSNQENESPLASESEGITSGKKMTKPKRKKKVTRADSAQSSGASSTSSEPPIAEVPPRMNDIDCNIDDKTRQKKKKPRRSKSFDDCALPTKKKPIHRSSSNVSTVADGERKRRPPRRKSQSGGDSAGDTTPSKKKSIRRANSSLSDGKQQQRRAKKSNGSPKPPEKQTRPKPQ